MLAMMYNWIFAIPCPCGNDVGPENDGRNEQVLTEAYLITYETSRNNNHISSLHCP
jgi:hypothetical protein